MSVPVVVRKYGGTSLATPQKIKRVASHIALTSSQGMRQVVVVSAMGKTTDDLCDMAAEVSNNPNDREWDLLLSAGERISMALLSMALNEIGIPALSLTGSQSGIITSNSHRTARIKRILGQRILGSLEQGRVVIVAGFQGVNENKDVTTLGRSGSDTTAVALAAFLKATSVEIYTDVDGVYSGDPRMIGKKAKLYSDLGSREMLEMASLGAQVLHPRSVELAQKFGIMIKVGEAQTGIIGTVVHPHPHPESESKWREADMEGVVFQVVTSDDSKVLVHVQMARPSVMGALWDQAAEQRLASVASMFHGDSIWFYADQDRLKDWKKILERLMLEGFVKSYHFHEDLCPVSVVGQCLSAEVGAINRVVDALSKHHVQVSLGSCNSHSITVAVPRTHMKEAVSGIHKELIQKQETA